MLWHSFEVNNPYEPDEGKNSLPVHVIIKLCVREYPRVRGDIPAMNFACWKKYRIERLLYQGH